MLILLEDINGRATRAGNRNNFADIIWTKFAASETGSVALQLAPTKSQVLIEATFKAACRVAYDEMKIGSERVHG